MLRAVPSRIWSKLCLNEQVDALLLAGDLYDGEQTLMKTARFLAGEIGRLHEAGIQVFIIRGNHDALSRITKELTFPEFVKVFGGRADVAPVERPGLAVAVHGLSFAQPKAPDSLLPRYRPPLPDMANIALMHTSLDGAPGHDDYAPCKAAERMPPASIIGRSGTSISVRFRKGAAGW